MQVSYYICCIQKRNKDMKAYNLEVKKVKRGYAVVYGVSILAKFKTHDEANKSLASQTKFYDYWANSASVAYQNRIAEGDFKTINC